MHTEIITDPPILDGCHGLSVETPGWSVGLFGGRYLHPKHHPQHAQVTWGSRLLHQNYRIIQASESKQNSYRRSYKNLPWDCHSSHARHAYCFYQLGGWSRSHGITGSRAQNPGPGPPRIGALLLTDGQRSEEPHGIFMEPIFAYIISHRIHGAGKYANMTGVYWWGSMLPYIAPWILWVWIHLIVLGGMDTNDTKPHMRRCEFVSKMGILHRYPKMKLWGKWR